MGGHSAPFAAAAEAGEASGRRPKDARWHFVCAADGMPLGGHAATLWESGDLLAAAEAVAGGGSLGPYLATLDEQGKLESTQAFLDGTFVRAKRGARQ